MESTEEACIKGGVMSLVKDKVMEAMIREAKREASRVKSPEEIRLDAQLREIGRLSILAMDKQDEENLLIQ